MKRYNFIWFISLNLAILLLVSLFGSERLYSQEYSGEIRSVVPHSTPFINYGPVFLNDTLEIKFVARNTGTLPIKIEQFIPTFFLGVSPNDPTTIQHERFRRNQPTRIYQPGEYDTIRISFESRDTLVSRTGWHEALLGLSFLPADKESNETIAKIDTFFLRVKKTPYFVSGFEDDINFDSVYVNPNVSQFRTWRVKNVWTQNQPLFDIERRLITQPFSRDEFLISDLPVNPLMIYPDSVIYMPISYYPLNRGRDSMFLKLLYHPLKEQFPDSVDFAWTRITGTGVEQDLRIESSNYNWSNDTIDIGNVVVGNKININISIKNKGNLPFGIVSQTILNDNSEIAHTDVKFIKPFQPDNTHLKPDSIMTAELEYLPDDMGYFFARIRIESDILSRHIAGVQPDKRFKYIYLKGNIFSPKIVLQVNEIDMGNVMLSNPECPSERDTLLYIFNAGNMEMLVILRLDPPYPDSKFIINEFYLLIPPGDGKYLKIQFRVASGDFNAYESNLIIKSFPFAPSDSIIIKLRANSVPPQAANLSISQDLKTKPGTLLEFPVVLSSNGTSPASFAKSFKTSLFYNRSMLEFVGIRTIGTACEGALNYGDTVENPDSEELRLDIKTPASNFFTPKDTLLFLKFKTYLGNSAATEITFIEPKLGDDKCDNLLTLLVNNGRYFTDSVCGLDYKALPSINGQFNLVVVVNGISGNNDIEVELPYSTHAVIRIIDVFGQPVKELLSQNLPSGKYQFQSNNSDLVSGIYFVELTTPAVRIIRTLPVVR